MRNITCICVFIASNLTTCASAELERSAAGSANGEMRNAPVPGRRSEDFDTPPMVRKGNRPLYPAGRLMAHESGQAVSTRCTMVVDFKVK